MTLNLDTRKANLIATINAVNSEEELRDIEKYVKIRRLTVEHGDIFKGMRKTISVEELKKEQNYQGIDREKFDKLVAELDIQEPIEELLAMLD